MTIEFDPNAAPNTETPPEEAAPPAEDKPTVEVTDDKIEVKPAESSSRARGRNMKEMQQALADLESGLDSRISKAVEGGVGPILEKLEGFKPQQQGQATEDMSSKLTDERKQIGDQMVALMEEVRNPEASDGTRQSAISQFNTLKARADEIDRETFRGEIREEMKGMINKNRPDSDMTPQQSAILNIMHSEFPDVMEKPEFQEQVGAYVKFHSTGPVKQRRQPNANLFREAAKAVRAANNLGDPGGFSPQDMGVMGGVPSQREGGSRPGAVTFSTKQDMSIVRAMANATNKTIEEAAAMLAGATKR